MRLGVSHSPSDRITSACVRRMPRGMPAEAAPAPTPSRRRTSCAQPPPSARSCRPVDWTVTLCMRSNFGRGQAQRCLPWPAEEPSCGQRPRHLQCCLEGCQRVRCVGSERETERADALARSRHACTAHSFVRFRVFLSSVRMRALAKLLFRSYRTCAHHIKLHSTRCCHGHRHSHNRNMCKWMSTSTRNA